MESVKIWTKFRIRRTKPESDIVRGALDSEGKLEELMMIKMIR
jgi:hypothetical protein